MPSTRRDLLIAGGALAVGGGYLQRRRIARSPDWPSLRRTSSIDIPEIPHAERITDDHLEAAIGELDDALDAFESREADPVDQRHDDWPDRSREDRTRGERALTETDPTDEERHEALSAVNASIRRLQTVIVIIDEERDDVTTEETEARFSDAEDRAQTFEIDYRGTDPSEAIIHLAASERDLGRARTRTRPDALAEPMTYARGAVYIDIRLRDTERFLELTDGPSIEDPLLDTLSTMAERIDGDLDATSLERDGAATAAYAVYRDLVPRFFDFAEVADGDSPDDPADRLRQACWLRAVSTSFSPLDTVVYPLDTDDDSALERVETTPDDLPDAKRAAVDAVEVAAADHPDDPLATEILRQATDLVERGDQTVDNMRSVINRAETPFWVRQTIEAYANYVAAEHAAEAVEDVLAEATW